MTVSWASLLDDDAMPPNAGSRDDTGCDDDAVPVVHAAPAEHHSDVAVSAA